MTAAEFGAQSFHRMDDEAGERANEHCPGCGTFTGGDTLCGTCTQSEPAAATREAQHETPAYVEGYRAYDIVGIVNESGEDEGGNVVEPSTLTRYAVGTAQHHDWVDGFNAKHATMYADSVKVREFFGAKS